jgi:hypothetical protein
MPYYLGVVGVNAQDLAHLHRGLRVPIEIQHDHPVIGKAWIHVRILAHPRQVSEAGIFVDGVRIDFYLDCTKKGLTRRMGEIKLIRRRFLLAGRCLDRLVSINAPAWFQVGHHRMH